MPESQEAAGGGIFFIEVNDKYPEGFDDTSSRTSSGQSQNVRPELASHVENMGNYDTICILTKQVCRRDYRGYSAVLGVEVSSRRFEHLSCNSFNRSFAIGVRA